MQDSLRELFRELADTTQEERERILAERRIPADVRAEIESLLGYDSRSGESLTRRVANAAEEALREGNTSHYCGSYKLVRLLGSGGMGAVYLAERRDGEIEQKVAIKLLRADADRPAWRDRFLKERQLLAYLNHPSIARLLDAGHTDDGRPYLVMEHVDGAAIDEYAERFDMRSRLRLFLLVCDGVSHAHRHLIVHRDLKPSNILVDSSGHPKLLDFGIAKILDPSEDETQTVERMLTPNYASPEQLRGDVQTTATDIYSLGAVLYKLLTGRTPREHEGPAQGLARIAETKEIAPASRWNPRLPADIDSILRKALRYEPEERYASVEALANDIRAFLDFRPVQARSGDAWYRTRKFLRRYWLPVSAAAVAAIGLSTGLLVATRERAIAQQRFLQVRKLAGHLIFDLYDEIKNVPGATRARDKLASTAVEYLNSLAQQARSDPDLAWDLLNAYDRLSQTRGGVGSNVGQTDEAFRLSETVVRLAESLEARGRIGPERLENLARVYDRLGRMYLDMRRKPETEKIVRKLLEVAPKLPPSRQAGAFLTAAVYEEQLGSDTRALEHGETAIRILENLPPEQADSAWGQRSGALLTVGRARTRFGLLEEALESYRASVPIYLAAIREGRQTAWAQRNLYLAHVWMADLLASDDRFNLGRPKEAEQHFRAAIALAEETVALDPRNEAALVDVARAAGKLGSAIYRSRPAESLRLMERAHALLTKTSLGNTSAAEMQLAYFLESVKPLTRLGHAKEAQANVNAATPLLEDLRRRNAARDWTESQIDIHMAQGLVFESLGEYAKALGEVNQEMTLIEKRKSQSESLGDDYRLVNALERIVRLGAHADRASAARAQKRLVEIWSRWKEKLPASRYVADRLTRAQAQMAAF